MSSRTETAPTTSFSLAKGANSRRIAEKTRK